LHSHQNKHFTERGQLSRWAGAARPRSSSKRSHDAAIVAAAGRAQKLMALKVTSPAFADGGEIPKRYTCDETDGSPALEWSGVPKTVQSLALIVDDPDAPDPAAPRMTWVHWVLYNLPATATALPE